MTVLASTAEASGPLAGLLVLDLTRMLPGAVLTRQLVDLGARVIKIEDPGVGDPMRSAPPLVDGVGAGFRAFMRGTESVCLDLRSAAGVSALLRLVEHADILVESFRPGTLARWGLGAERLEAANPRLVSCSLSGFGQSGPQSARVAHDVNLVGASGLLSRLPSGLPNVQVADVTTGLLAATAILGALLTRYRTQRGAHLDQPLAAGPLPFLTWAWADHSAIAIGPDTPEPGLLGTLLHGEGASYGLYACADGLELAVGVIEPKFWRELTGLLGCAEIAEAGLAVGQAGARARARVAECFARMPRAHWLALCEERNLPVTAVNDLEAGLRDASDAARIEHTALPSGRSLTTPAPYVAGLAAHPHAPAPALGAHTPAVFAEFGLTPAT